MKKQDIYNKVIEVESHIKATGYQIQITSGKYDLLDQKDKIVCRGNIFKIEEYCHENDIYDCRYEDIKCIYKMIKQDSKWGDWFVVYSLPKNYHYDASCFSFYPHTRNYTIETLTGNERYYIEY